VTAPAKIEILDVTEVQLLELASGLTLHQVSRADAEHAVRRMATLNGLDPSRALDSLNQFYDPPARVEWSGPADSDWPHPPALEAYQGPLGAIALAIAPHTEADPAGILVQLLVGFGNLIGKAPAFMVGKTTHSTKENACIVGETSSSRKGTGGDEARHYLGLIDSGWADKNIRSGLATGEGLIAALADKKSDGGPADTDPDRLDKRMQVYESEFSRVLQVMARKDSTLSSIVRDAFDKSDLRIMTKTDPIAATGTHISIIAHCTMADLRAHLTETEMANGFGNRFLWIAVRRARELPDPPDVFGEVSSATPLFARLIEAVQFARSGPVMTRSPKAAAMWAREYHGLTEGEDGLVGAMLGRGAAHVTRLSMIYALAEGSATIKVRHLRAAFALWDYAARSVRFLFNENRPSADDERLLAAFEDAGGNGLTRTEISEVFNRHKSKDDINGILKRLAGRLTSGYRGNAQVLVLKPAEGES